jgi:outer membrane protein
MMKNLSLVLNLVLLAAVGYLYYYNFSGKKQGKSVDQTGGMNMAGDSNSSRSPIAYVELDSLNENITYIKERRKELETEQRNIETDWENGYKGLQAAKDNFLKKGTAISQEEAEKFQGQLIEQQQQIDGKKQALTQKLSEKSFTIMDDIQKKLKEFLAEYNKEKKYIYILTTGSGQDYMAYKDPTLNITNDVIRGMNIKMKSLSK